GIGHHADTKDGDKLKFPSRLTIAWIDDVTIISIDESRTGIEMNSGQLEIENTAENMVRADPICIDGESKEIGAKVAAGCKQRVGCCAPLHRDIKTVRGLVMPGDG